jgi:flagellar motor switch protein FliG
MKSARFNNLTNLTDTEMKEVLNKVKDNKVLAISLKNMTEQFKTQVMENLPEERRELVKEELKMLGFIELDDIKKAKKEIETITKETI